MNNLQQVETVQKALELAVHIEEQEDRLSELSAAKYAPAPQPPVHETVKRNYPPIDPKTRFHWGLAIIPSILFWPWIVIYYFLIYKKKKEEEIERIRNSEVYKAQCAAADEAFDKQQKDADQRYEIARTAYETDTLPKYKEDLAAWNAQHKEELQKIEIDLQHACDSLDNLYATTKIIPLPYRNMDALQYLYDLMSTSEYDIKQAIDLYDRQQQRKLEEAKLYEQQQANALANAQNELLEEQNAISRKARRDANLAAITGAVQRHNTNKALKGISGNFFGKK